MNSRCPSCLSKNVATGFMGKVLSCEYCKWSHLNEYPCDTCGSPSVGIAGAGRKRFHWCPAHSGEGMAAFEAAVVQVFPAK